MPYVSLENILCSARLGSISLIILLRHHGVHLCSRHDLQGLGSAVVELREAEEMEEVVLQQEQSAQEAKAAKSLEGTKRVSTLLMIGSGRFLTRRG